MRVIENLKKNAPSARRRKSKAIADHDNIRGVIIINKQSLIFNFMDQITTTI